jgi:hypothetical protein
VKDISLESFLSNLLSIGIDSEIQREGGCIEGKEAIMRSDTCGWMAMFNKQQNL